MTNPFHTLIIEDHELIIDAYLKALKHISSKNSALNFRIHTAKNCDQAIAEIENAVNNKPIDFVFLDISLPPQKRGGLYPAMI